MNLFVTYVQEATVTNSYKFSKYISRSLYFETFLHLRVTWQFAKLYGMSDYMLCHYINQYAPGKRPHMQCICTYLVDGGYVSTATEEDYKRRQCYILHVIFAMVFCLLVLQGKPCWLYWNSNLIELRTFGLTSDLIILNYKFAYFGLYTQAS